MLVHELIEMLQNQDPNAEVLIQEPTKCYWNRNAAKDIVMVESLPVKHSDYYNSLVIKEDEGGEYDEGTGGPLMDENAKTVVVICSSGMGM